MKRYYLVFLIFLPLYTQYHIANSNMSLDDFFTSINVKDNVIKQDFLEYYQHFLHNHKHHKKHRFHQLQEQALCDIQVYHPEWNLADTHTVKDTTICCSLFLTYYGLFIAYKKERLVSHNGTLFRLGSYIKDTVKTYSGWFKSASKKERYLRRTEGCIS